MVNFTAFVSGILAASSLILVAISLATSFWVRVDFPRNPDEDLNPVLTNDELRPLVVSYDLEYFGLWVACYKVQGGGEVSCGYVGSKCFSSICWIRTGDGEDDRESCIDHRVTTIKNCSAYQAVRAMSIIGTLCLIAGTSLMMVSACFSSKALTAAGGIIIFLASFFLMVAFAVWQSEIFRKPGLDSIASTGWSFILLIVAWPLAFLASLLGYLASTRQRKDDSFEPSG